MSFIYPCLLDWNEQIWVSHIEFESPPGPDICRCSNIKKVHSHMGDNIIYWKESVILGPF